MQENSRDSYVKNPFQSFVMAGYECADHLNAFGERVDLIQLTGHDQLISDDYNSIHHLGISTVREGIRWSFVEKTPFVYDWSQVEDIILNAQNIGIQIIWDICHFGFPDDLTPLHPMFARRFSELCKAFVLKYRSLVPDGILIVTPVNEVSFLSWLGGDARGTSPYCVNQGWEVKYMLMKAYVEGIEQMKSVDPDLLIMTTEPLVNIIASDPDNTSSVIDAAHKHNEQYQVLDMLTGKICPELRGKPEYLDIIGLNFYYNNQWTYPEHQFIPWNDTPPDPRWRKLQHLIEEVFLRFQKPIVISETSHPKEDRPKWFNMITNECIEVLNKRLPLYGCCLYPIIDRPDWDFPEQWHQSGLWDISNVDTLERKLHKESLQALQKLLAVNN